MRGNTTYSVTVNNACGLKATFREHRYGNNMRMLLRQHQITSVSKPIAHLQSNPPQSQPVLVMVTDVGLF